MAFTRENRYIVIKRSDLDKCISSLSREALDGFNDVVQAARDVRVGAGKPELSGVFVEEDWPESDLVWELIRARVEGSTFPAREPRADDAQVGARMLTRHMQLSNLPIKPGPQEWMLELLAAADAGDKHAQ